MVWDSTFHAQKIIKTNILLKCFPIKNITYALGHSICLGFKYPKKYPRKSDAAKKQICSWTNPQLSPPSTCDSRGKIPDNSSGSRPALQTNVLSRSNSFRCQKQYATSPPRNRHPGDKIDKIQTQIKGLADLHFQWSVVVQFLMIL